MSPRFIGWNPNPQVMAVGREAFGGCWGVGGAAVEGLVPFIIQQPLDFVAFPILQNMMSSSEPARGPCPSSRLLDRGCPAFRAIGNTFLLLIRHTHVRIVVFC